MSRKKAELVARTGSDWGGFTERRAPWIAVALVLLGTVRIVATYAVFNHTIDEPAHIACGMQWLAQGKYAYEALHPPLARVMTAVGPYLDGVRSAGRPEMYREGAAILYGPDGSTYDRRLALARMGILPFFWMASAVVYLWSARWFGRTTAVAAVLLFTFLPAILAHSGVATTDMALTATLGAALYALLRMVEEPTLKRGAVFGLCGGLAVLSKFTSAPFFLASVAAAGLVYVVRTRTGAGALARKAARYAAPAALAGVVALLTVWAGYRFSVGPNPYVSFTMPAPEFFGGMEMVRDKAKMGHPSYLLGATSQYGFWYYYPVALAVKLPLAFLVLAFWGAVLCWKKADPRYWTPVSFAAGLVAFALTSPVNIGTRHIMPLFIFLSLVGAVAVTEWMKSQRPWLPKAVMGLVTWLAVSSALSHPDYLAYFNALAGDEPEKVLVDSDLDWGQDMKRLAARLQRSNAQQVYFNPLILAHLEAVHGFPPIAETNAQQPEPGWTAVSLTVLKAARLGLYREAPEIDPWPNRVKPMERVGKGVYLYYFRPQQGSR